MKIRLITLYPLLLQVRMRFLHKPVDKVICEDEVTNPVPEVKGEDEVTNPLPEVIGEDEVTNPVPEVIGEDEVPGEGLSKCFVEIQDF